MLETGSTGEIYINSLILIILIEILIYLIISYFNTTPITPNKTILICILVNIMSNPLLNMLHIHIGFPTLFLEAAIILLEGFLITLLYMLYKIKYPPYEPFILSLIANIISITTSPIILTLLKT